MIRIKPSFAKHFVIAHPSAKNFLQTDGSLLVQLEKALYGLPEAGKLRHELLKDNLTACGYKHRPNDTTTWKRVERKDGKTAAVSIILVFVDDFMHIWKIYTGSDRIIRDKLHADLRTKGIPHSPQVQPSRREQLDIVPGPKHSDVTEIPLIRVTAGVCNSTLRAVRL